MNNLNLNRISEISTKHNSTILYNEKLSSYTSFKIGGRCTALIKVNSISCLQETMTACKEDEIPYYVMGKGSNVLIPDEGLNGLVILISDSFSEIKVEDNFIECMAGVSLNNLCRTAKEHGLTGLEFAYGIPGTVGGAVYMNAGAYGGQMEDVVVSCCYLDYSDFNNVIEINKSMLDFSYRRSFFTKKEHIIVSARFELLHGNADEINKKMNELMQKRRDKQPLEYPSAGSAFKRPENDYASRLIEDCGLKGVSVGAAEVSVKHSGFIINKGGATFHDVMGLINLVKEKVQEKTGVILECEVEIAKLRNCKIIN